MKKVLLLLSLFCTPLLHAQEDAEQWLQHVESYLNSLSSLQADFTEVVFHSGQWRTGTFSYQKPGRFRWQYAQPTSATLVGTGSRVFFYDAVTHQITQVPRNVGFLGLLSQKEWRLETDKTRVSNIATSDKHVTVALSFPSAGGLQPLKEMLLVFRREPLQLQELVTIDPLDRRVHVGFSAIAENAQLDPGLFKFVAEQHPLDN